MEIVKKNSGGFSLIELIIVIIILGIISTVIYIRWSASRTDLDVQAAIFTSNLRYTQSLSMARNERYRLKIIMATSTTTNTASLPAKYQILDQNDTAETHLPGADKESDTAITLKSGVFFGQLVGINNTLIFDGQGVPYSDIDLQTPLMQEVTITLKNTSGSSRTVHVTPITGKITLR